MIPALRLQLYERFPQLLRTRPETRLDVGDGWYSIIFALCEEIETHVSANGIQPHPRFLHVMQESGHLKVDVEHADEFVSQAIARAVQKASETCELCGARGNAEEHYWVLRPCENDPSFREDSKC